MNDVQRDGILRFIELLTTYKDGFGTRYSGWTEADYRNTLGAACGIVNNIEATLAQEMGMEPGDWMQRLALQVQLDS